jgi:hypothetical protein
MMAAIKVISIRPQQSTNDGPRLVRDISRLEMIYPLLIRNRCPYRLPALNNPIIECAPRSIGSYVLIVDSFRTYRPEGVAHFQTKVSCRWPAGAGQSATESTSTEFRRMQLLHGRHIDYLPPPNTALKCSNDLPVIPAVRCAWVKAACF